MYEQLFICSPMAQRISILIFYYDQGGILMSRQNLHTDTTAPGHGAASRGTCPEGHHRTDSADHEHEHSHSCGCGHDHHHHHDDSAECDHDHHHDDSCGCGHDHHHHGDSCGCGHDHGDAQPPHTEMPSAYKGKARIFLLENLGCAHCAAQMEEKIQSCPAYTSRISHILPGSCA